MGSAANEETIAHLRFLFDSYEPRCMYFEVVETFRKLLLTGMLVFFFPDTPSQIVVGLLIAFASAIIYSRYRPYVEDDDDFVSEVAQCKIFFVLLSALLSLI